MTDAEAAVESFVDRYAEEFSTGDPEVVASHFHEPAMLVSGDGVRTLADREEVEHLFAAVFEDLHGRGYGSSEARETTIQQLGPDRALATVDWVRYTTDDDVLEEITATHLFRRTDDGWKMVVLLPHEQ